jgi:signal recognition particle subunit SRP54
VAQDFTLNDFKRQVDQLQKMGMSGSLRRVPGMSEMIGSNEDPDVALNRIRQIIEAMTEEERNSPDIIDSNRRSRIGSNSGIQPSEVETFLAQFRKVRALMRQVAGMSIWQRIKMMTGFGKPPGLNRGA